MHAIHLAHCVVCISFVNAVKPFGGGSSDYYWSLQNPHLLTKDCIIFQVNFKTGTGVWFQYFTLSINRGELIVCIARQTLFASQCCLYGDSEELSGRQSPWGKPPSAPWFLFLFLFFQWHWKLLGLAGKTEKQFYICSEWVPEDSELVIWGPSYS